MNKRLHALRFGVAPAMATPLQRDGQTVNAAAIPDLVNFLLARGVKGLFIGGSTGEGIMLGLDQRQKLHEAALQAVAGRGAVLLHIGANDLDSALVLTRHAVRLQPDAVVAITPTFFPLHDDALLDYFATLATVADGLPFFVYDIPHMAVNGISPALWQRLATDVPNLAGLKTSRSDAQVIRQLLDSSPESALVMAGNERIALGSLSMGASGLISGLATAIPEPFVALVEAVRQGDLAAARDIQKTINNLLDCLPAGARLGAIKRLLIERDIPAGPPVPPRPEVIGSLWPTMERILVASRVIPHPH